MQYSYILKNPDRILRPVTVDDAEFIVKLRNQEDAKWRINDTSADVEKQRQWIRDYLKRENEYYWISETHDHRPMGTTSLYHYVAERKEMETGRWVRMKDAPQTNLLAARVQMNDFVFNVLGLKRLVFDVATINKQVLRYHRMCGAVETRIDKALFIIQGKPIDMVWFEETPESWARVRPKILHWAGLDSDLVQYGTWERILI